MKLNEIKPKDPSLISIIVPIYNTERYIKNCLNSIINQTYQNLEVILVDDKSTDGTLRVIEQYLGDKRIKVIKKSVNRGVSNSRNIGLREAKGDYIMFVDSDDYIAPSCVETIYKLSIENSSDIVFFNYKKVKDFDEKFAIQSSRNGIIQFSKDEIRTIISSMLTNTRYKIDPSIFGFSWGKLYRRKVIENIDFNEKIRFREDTLFNIQAYQNAQNIIYCNTQYYFYYVNKDAASFRFFENYELEIEEFFNELREKTNFIDKDTWNICGLYMYMNFLKHYVLHKKTPRRISYKLIKDTFNHPMWKNFFENVTYSQISLPYRVLVFFFRYKVHYGVMLLFKLNEILKRK